MSCQTDKTPATTTLPISWTFSDIRCYTANGWQLWRNIPSRGCPVLLSDHTNTSLMQPAQLSQDWGWFLWSCCWCCWGRNGWRLGWKGVGGHQGKKTGHHQTSMCPDRSGPCDTQDMSHAAKTHTLKCDVLTHGHCTDINKHASPYTDSKKQTASQVRFKNCIQKNSSHTVCTKSNLKQPLMIISAFCFCSSLFNDVCLLVILSLPRKCWWNFEKHSVKSLVTVQWSRRDCLMLSTVTQSCAVATKASDVCKNAILLYLHTFVQSVQIVAVYISYPLFHFVFFHSGCSPSCTTGKIAIIFCQWHHPSGHTQRRWTNH